MMQRSLARNARVGVVFSGDAPTVRPVASSAGRRRGCCAVAAKAPLANDAPSASSPRISQLAHSSSSLRRREATFSLIVARAAGDEGSSGSDGDEDEKVRLVLDRLISEKKTRGGRGDADVVSFFSQPRLKKKKLQKKP